MPDPRQVILDAANRRRPVELPPFGRRQIQQAVFKCVQRRLVAPSVLRAAGFPGAARRLQSRARVSYLRAHAAS